MDEPVLQQVRLHRVIWVLPLLIPIAFAGFYKYYFNVFFDTDNGVQFAAVTHLHNALMLCWLYLAVSQPWLIKLERFSLHRTMGRVSYVLMPVILVSGFFVLRFAYQKVLGGDTSSGPAMWLPADLPIQTKAAMSIVIGSINISLLTTYYLLGVAFRRTVTAHATFMFAAALVILGPAGDRLVETLIDAAGLPYNAIAENSIFALVGTIFLLLAISHFMKRTNYWPAITVLTIHVIGVLLYYYLPNSYMWSDLCYFLFAPAI